jgi:hypothetical protein
MVLSATNSADQTWTARCKPEVIVSLLIPAGYSQMNLVWQGTTNDRPCEVALGFHGPPGELPADAADDIYSAAIATNSIFQASQQSTTWRFLGVKVMTMTESGPTTGELLLSVVGTLSVANPPINCAVLLRKNTDLGGRTNRGRIFAPPTELNESEVDYLGNMTSTAVTRHLTHWNNFVSGLDAVGKTLRLYHTASAVPTVVNSLSVQQLIATQRRRMRS